MLATVTGIAELQRISRRAVAVFVGILVVVTGYLPPPCAVAQSGALAPLTPENAAQIEPLARLGQGRIDDLAYSPNGAYIAAASTLGVWLFEAAQLDAAPQLLSQPHCVSDVAWSPDGQLLAATDSAGTVTLWNVAGRTVVQTIDAAPWVWWTSWSPDGRFMAFAYPPRVLIREAVSGEEIIDMQEVEYLSGPPAWSADRAYIAAQSEEHVQVWDAATGEKLDLDHSQLAAFYPGRVAWSPDGRQIASAGPVAYEASLIPIWEVPSGRTLHTLELGCRAYLARWSRDGKYFAAACAQGPVTVWDAGTWNIMREWPGGDRPIEFLAWTPEGHLLTADAVQLRVWDTATGDQIAISTPLFWVGSVSLALSPDDTTLAAATGGYLALWNLDSGTPTTVLSVPMAYRSGFMTVHRVPVDQFNRPTGALAWSPDGTRLAIMGGGAGLRVWHVPRRELLFEHDFERSMWSPDGSEIVHLSPRSAAGGWDIVFHDGWTGEATRQLDMPFKRDPDTNTVFSGSKVVWSPEGTLQAIAAPQTQGIPYTIWDATTGEELYLLSLAPYSRLSAPLWSPDGTRMAIRTGDSPSFVLIWDVSANRLQHAIEARFVNGIAWSPDGRLLAGAYDFGNGGVLVWDAATGALLTTLDGHRGPVNRVLWSADGTRLISGSRDGTVVVWGVITD